MIDISKCLIQNLIVFKWLISSRHILPFFQLDVRNEGSENIFSSFHFLSHEGTWSVDTLYTLRISVHALLGYACIMVDANLFRSLTVFSEFL
jgi:hypothetical protein